MYHWFSPECPIDAYPSQDDATRTPQSLPNTMIDRSSLSIWRFSRMGERLVLVRSQHGVSMLPTAPDKPDVDAPPQCRLCFEAHGAADFHRWGVLVACSSLLAVSGCASERRCTLHCSDGCELASCRHTLRRRAQQPTSLTPCTTMSGSRTENGTRHSDRTRSC